MFERIKICTVIVNFNGLQYNLPCLQSVSSQNITFANQIILVDNCSTDTSIAAISALQMPNIHILKLDKNYLFAYGCNRGIEYALAHGAKYVFILNNDTIVAEDCLSKLVVFLQTHPEYAGVQPLLTRMHEPHIVASAGCCISRMGAAWDKDNGKFVSEMPEQHFPVAGITAGACLWRSDVLRSIGLFDESFRMYFEDVDLSLRAHKAGFQLCTLPNARVKHMVSATTNEAPSGFCVQHCQTNALRIILKHWPNSWLVQSIVLWTVVSSAIIFSSMFHNKWKTAKACIYGFLEGIKLLPHGLCSRFAVQNTENQALKKYIAKNPFPPSPESRK